ncbi:MAG: hypothetical protein DMG79_21915 [Acidobacteria bacterium]|nr:MAG: hypothetical protein DMG79_21915 [Acidobacteriota bacterium]
MIRSFRHRGLKRFYERDDRSGIRPDLVGTVDLPGYRLHPLKGNLKGFWSVTVRANWCKFSASR